MADVNNSGDDQVKSIEALEQQLNALQVRHDKLNKDYRDLKATSSESADLQKQLDKAITDNSKLMAEKTSLETQFADFKTDIQKKEVNSHLTTALEAAGARNSTAVAKQIDWSLIKYDENGNVQQTSIAEAVNAIKVSDSWMFKDEGEVSPNGTTTSTSTTGGQLPPVKHAADRLTDSGFITELNAAVATGKQSNIDAVQAKYATL